MSYISVCYNEGCGGTEVFEHPMPVMWICRDCREKGKLPMPEITKAPDPKPVADMNEAELREHIELQQEYNENNVQYKDIELLVVRNERNQLLEDIEGVRDILKQTRKGFDLVAKWLSAALDDPKVCNEMKRDIHTAFQWRGDD